MLEEMNAVQNHVAIETEQLWRTYKLGSQQEVAALRGIKMKIKAGQFVALKGRSGSGKTTLLNCVGGLDRATSGVVRVFGQDISTLSDQQLTQWRRDRLGFIFQSFALSPTMSAYENVELILRIKGKRGGKRLERTNKCLDLVGLTRWKDHRPDEMSGGQQQRVAIARSLANNPELILADEPTGELDSATAREIFSLFRRVVHEERLTLLVASHDSLVDEFADEVLHLVDGQILLEEERV